MTLEKAIDEALDILLTGEKDCEENFRKVPVKVLYTLLVELTKEDDEQ